MSKRSNISTTPFDRYRAAYRYFPYRGYGHGSQCAEKKRITKESFQKFLEGQNRYKLYPSNDYEELAQEQNIALANFRRKKLSQTGIRGSNGNIKYITFDEASYLAKVSRSMINKWADKGKFTVIKVGSRVRILRDEFEDWMEQRDLERSMQ